MDKSLDLPDFDQLVKLAQEDPEALEVLRKSLCEAVIQQAPESYHQRLRGLQFKIDMERRRAKTPMAACVRLSTLMQDSFQKLRLALNDVSTQRSSAEASSLSCSSTISMATVTASSQESPSTARIIKFPSR